MALDLSQDCVFTGPALPEPFVKFNLETELNRLSLLPKATGPEVQTLAENWGFARRKLQQLVAHGGGLRVQNHVIEPLMTPLGYAHLEPSEDVQTREGAEAGGALLCNGDPTARLRVWCVDLNADLDAPARRGLAYRFSHLQIARRVLTATGERLGLITNGVELRVVISDPARTDSQITIAVDPHWKRSREVPDSFRLLLALASPKGVKALPDLIEKARLQQARVTKDLRLQARLAVEGFIQEILDDPDNAAHFESIRSGLGNEARAAEPRKADERGGSQWDARTQTGAPGLPPSPPSEGREGQVPRLRERERVAEGRVRVRGEELSTPGEVGLTYDSRPLASDLRPLTSDLARSLWHEGLITVYRLLFILKLESTDDPARSFSFASTSLWRNTFSPSVALAPLVRAILDHGQQTGSLLSDGLHSLFRMLGEGLQCTEMNVRPMAGALFAPGSTPILSSLHWSEHAVARMLDNLLWTRPGRNGPPQRVHYGPLDVEDLGRVYEALLELEPGITAETMCRLRRAKLEVVVPAAQGERYRPQSSSPAIPTRDTADPSDPSDSSDDEPEEEEEAPVRGKKTKVEWIEEIPPGRFYLRVGLGRKATGSFYTPHSFVRFLVQETLGPLSDKASPADDPQPGALLKLKVIDKAMGSGHFLVEACRFLGEKLYEAARRCDELALAAEHQAEAPSLKPEERETLLATASGYRQRVVDLPDPEDELVRYLPSRAPEGRETGFSLSKARALCRRMVAVHCLYGVDKNPLAVELAKLALWIECHAEGLPLTFLDHRLVVGDSLTGPFFEHLLKYPGSQQPLDDLFTRELTAKLTAALADALQHVRALEATVGVTVADIEAKQAAKTRLDRALAPFKILAAAWSGGVMLGPDGCDDTAYAALAKHIAETGAIPNVSPSPPSQGEEGLVPRPREWEKVAEGRVSGVGEEPTLLGEVGFVPSKRLCRMVAKGLGMGASADLRPLTSDLWPHATPALSFDLAFPEVFYPDGNAANRAGFDADLGNPPWDRIEVPEEEFWANYDLGVLSVDDKKARQPMIAAIAERLPESGIKWAQFIEEVEGQFRLHQAFYHWQTVKVNGKNTTGRPDLYRLFAERAAQVLRPGGQVGCVYPSAIHANEGATGVRQLYLEHMLLRCCYSFENKRALFEIHRSFKFAAIVAQHGGFTNTFDCGFYLHDDSWLFATERQPPALHYTLDFVRRTGGQLLTFAECRSQVDADLLDVLHSSGVLSLGTLLERDGLDFAYGVELHRNPDFNLPLRPPRFASEISRDLGKTAPELVPVVEGKAFNQFTDTGDYPVDVCAPLAIVLGKSKWNPAVAFYRLAYREVASSTNERTLICAVLPPGIITNHKAAIETQLRARTNGYALALAAVLNSFFADWQVRQKAGSTVSSFIFRATKIPETLKAQSLLSHSALRLTCNHAGYAPLWREQLGEAWREADAPFTWPVLSGDDQRWAVRAAIDAVVAHAYGLTRDQYAHVLSTFSHSSYKDAPRECLAAFDELHFIGLEAFTKKHDPYWNIPLNENLPQPVIDLPMPAAALREEGPAYHTADLFDLQSTTATSGNAVPPGEQPSIKRRRRRANN